MEKMENVTSRKSSQNVRNMMFCAIFTVLIAVGAFIKIPIPVVPFTLQVLFVLLAGLLLGSKLGTLSSLIYMLLGLVGVPIFTEGGGFWYILKPPFGYIVGFVVGAFVTGKIVESRKKTELKWLLIANFAGLMVVYLFGIVYCYIICNFVIDTPIAVWPLLVTCLFLPIPGDIALCILGALLAKKLRPFLLVYRTEERKNGMIGNKNMGKNS